MPTAPRLPLLCIFLTIAMGSWGRLAQVGERGLWTDELNHHFTAQSLAAGKGPLLPSGQTYRRGLSLSHMVAYTQQRVGDPELAVRLPAALFGILNLILIAAVAWVLAGPWAAVWATALLAFYPEVVDQSRNGRFYTYQLNFGLVALIGGWFATRRHDGAGHGNSAGQLAWGWGWMLLTGAALYLGYKVQPTMLAIVVAVGVWIGLIAIDDLRRDGRLALRRSVPVQAVAFVLLGAGALLVAGSLGSTLANWWAQSQSKASWVGPEYGSPRFYLGKLSERVPWVLSLFPLFALIALRRAPRLALYLLAWFVIPLAIHSLMLAWKGERYFLNPLPALFILAGIGVAVSLGVFRRAVREAFAERRLAGGAVISAALVAAASLWAVITLPGFTKTRQLRSDLPDVTAWMVASEILRETPGIEDIPWGSMDPLVSLHYWKRADFGVQPGLLDYAVDVAPYHPPLRFPPATDSLPRDFYTGVPLTTTAPVIRRAYAPYGAVIIGLVPAWTSFVDADLARTLAREGRDLCEHRCPNGFALYLWRLSPDATATDVLDARRAREAQASSPLAP